MDLIDKDATIKALKKQHMYFQNEADERGGEAVLLAEGLSDAIEIVSDVPVVIVIPSVVHAHWIMRGGRFRCSACDANAKWDFDGSTGGFSKEYKQAVTPYCPACGARMG